MPFHRVHNTGSNVYLTIEFGENGGTTLEGWMGKGGATESRLM